MTQRNNKMGLAKNERARQSSPYTRVSPVIALPVSTEELLMLAKRETGRINRPNWAKDVLSLVQSKPNEWIKLAGRHNLPDATRYLKPLGIKYASTGHDSEYKGVVLFVKWETES
jgi:hypothetical protein